MDSWNERLEVWRVSWVNQDKWDRQLKQLVQERRDMQEKADHWLERLNKEQQDVERLRSMSLINLFYTILGRKADELDEQQKEVVEATLKYEEAAMTVVDMDREINDLETMLDGIGNLEAEYALIMEEKERLIHDTDSPMSQAIYEVVELIAEARGYLKEMNEAINAGEGVLHSLYLAQDSLGSAGRWGAWDMIGGGMISTAIKHSRVNDAQEHIHETQRRMRHFHKELQDIEQHIEVHFDTGGILKFADFFFDGLIVDWVVQGRIQNSEKQVVAHSKRIAKVMEQLRSERGSWDNRMVILQKEYTTLVEEAK